jgi:ABC-type bacteriocin/lantibiotic exporter with double-glycine peptidase domain
MLRVEHLMHGLRLLVAVMSLGCATYRGTATSAEPVALARQGNWYMVASFPLVRQEKSNDCGAAALASVLKFWGRPATPSSIEAAIGRKEARLRAGDMAEYARKQGLRAYVFFGTMNDVVYELKRGRPVIVGLGKEYAEKKAISHYEVVVGYEPKQKRVLLLDPGRGWQVDSLDGFAEEWVRSKGVTLVAFEPPGKLSQK